MPASTLDLDAQFDDLWRRCKQPHFAEWAAFYPLVHNVLSTRSFPIEEGLPERREVYIAEFFQDRLLHQSAPPRPVNIAYLVVMFRNYLCDRQRDPWLRHREPTAHDTENAPVDHMDHHAASPGDIEQMLDLLHGHGLQPAAIQQAAQAFLNGHPPWDALQNELWWIRPYLAQHFCADQTAALSTLAHRLDIPAHHYKAQKLGITAVKGGFPDHQTFRATYLGQWIARIGIDLEHEEAPALVCIALKILCRTALIEQEHCAGNARP